jgi:hypothetical protein
MPICRALLKHGHENLSLSIIEYCEPEKCIENNNCFFYYYNHSTIFYKKLNLA